MNHQFTAPVSVWISSSSRHDAISLQSASDVEGLIIWESTFEGMDGYTRVGTGQITIDIASKDEIITGKVESLRSELAKDRAESQARQNALIRKISELEALTYEPAAIPD